MELDGRVAAITGGTAGIGRAIAAAFLAEGTRVVVSGVVFHQGDATTKEGVEQTVEAAVENFGQIDIMVGVDGGTAAY